MAIIICAHAFMNFTNIWSISHREKTYVKLGEITDLFDLTSNAAFNTKKFLALIKQFNAVDAVEWAASIAYTLFGRNPFPIPCSIKSVEEPCFMMRFPRCLWWNFWLAIPIKREELLQKNWFSMRSLITHIRSNVLNIKMKSSGTYTTLKHTSALLLERFITQNFNIMPVFLEIVVNENDIIICLKILTKFERIRIDFGSVASEYVFSPQNGIQTIGANSNISLVTHNIGYEIQVAYARNILNQVMDHSNVLHLLIGIGKQSNSKEMADSILIPLTLYILLK